MDMLHTTGVLNSGKKIDYAFGLVVSEYKGLKVVEHDGAWVGFRATIVRFPEQRFSVVILANLDAINPSGLAFNVADIYLADLIKAPAKEEAKKTPTITMPKGELEALAGNWQDVGFGLWLTLAMKDDKLIATLAGQNFVLAAVAPGKFIVPGNAAGIMVEFEAAEKGKHATRARIAIGANQEFRFEKAAPIKTMSAAELGEYAGTYVSEELLDAHYIVSVAKDTLVVKSRTMPEAPLQTMAPDKFTLPDFGMNIEFVRGAGGKVTGFTMSVGRAAEIAFVKR
jgi:hypothetical protein